MDARSVSQYCLLVAQQEVLRKLVHVALFVAVFRELRVVSPFAVNVFFSDVKRLHRIRIHMSSKFLVRCMIYERLAHENSVERRRAKPEGDL